MPLNPRNTLNEKQSGVSLIEILIALFTLSIGLLGLAAMQAQSLQFNQSAQMRTQATILANDIIDRMRANNDPNALVTYVNEAATTTPGQTCEGAGVTCTTSQMATADVGRWRETISDRLPQGTGEIENLNNLMYEVTITWLDRDDTTRTFTIQAPL